MPRRHILLMFAAVVAPAIFYACDDTATTIGSTLISNDVEIIVDEDYTVTGNSVPVAAIRPKTTQQMIGRIDIPGYGTLTSDFVTQFLPSTELDDETFTAENLDSLVLTMRYGRGAFIGDSIAPMGFSIYELTEQINSGISSDFNPAGCYNTTPLASKIYNASTLNDTITVQAKSYRDITVKLPVELGRRLFNAYVENPANYANGQVFAKNVFPGIYLKNTYGNGRMTLVSICAMSMYFSKTVPATVEGDEPEVIEQAPLYYLVTPEVVNNNILTYKSAAGIDAKLQQGKSLIVAPIGAEVEFAFPLQKMLSRYRADGSRLPVVNTLTMSIPVDSIENGFGVEPPPYVLMVLKKDREEFFAKNKLPDNKTSFYAAFNAAKMCYSFTNMRGYIMEMLEKEEITADDFTFDLVPVQVNFEDLASGGSYYYYSSSASQTESEVLPYLISPAMCEVKLDDVQIKFTYTLQGKK